jgi:hypothetical protein
MSSRDYIKHVVSANPPTALTVGDEWFNPTTNLLYKRVANNGTVVGWDEVLRNTPATTTGTGLVVLSDSPTINTSLTVTGVLNLTGNTTQTQSIATSATTGSLNIYTGQTTGILNIGGNANTTTGAINIGRSIVTQVVAIATGATQSGFVKTVNLGTGGQSNATTNINIGSIVTGHVNNIRIYGNIGINTGANSAYQLQVNGAFAATTKSFVIPHPTKPEKQLRYGSLEGPENGVYIRGRLKGDKIQLPEYWTKLVDPDSITVNLTPIGKYQKLYVEDIINNTVIISNDNMLNKEVSCFYTVYAERIDVEKLQVEID